MAKPLPSGGPARRGPGSRGVATRRYCLDDRPGRRPLVTPASGYNDAYLATKAKRFGHIL